MRVTEHPFSLLPPSSPVKWVEEICVSAQKVCSDGVLLRAIIDGNDGQALFGEALSISCGSASVPMPRNNFQFIRRPFEDTSSFNAALIVPTGVGAELGGHAGDAGPLTLLFGAICDSVITHPNVVNASDINESPVNTYYVEGSVLTRLLLGNVALQPVRNNKILLVIDEHPDPIFTHAALNATNAARATYGLDCDTVIRLADGVRLRVDYSPSGRAVGEVSNLESLIEQLVEHRSNYDAVAISSVITVPPGYHQQYFESAGTMVNPWGGVEAMLTHAISSVLEVPSAHAPMFESQAIANSDPGVVDARMSAEAVSLTFLQCVLKGLRRSPRIIADATHGHSGMVDATNISCLVIPDGCIGIPTLAALAQGITTIAVRENTSLMQNDLFALPWEKGQLHVVENYWEAAGVVAALRAGISPKAVRRPFAGLGSYTVSSLADAPGRSEVEREA